MFCLRRRRGLETNEKQLEFCVATFEAKLNGYEAILSKQKYLAGNVRAPSPVLSSRRAV